MYVCGLVAYRFDVSKGNRRRVWHLRTAVRPTTRPPRAVSAADRSRHAKKREQQSPKRVQRKKKLENPLVGCKVYFCGIKLISAEYKVHLCEANFCPTNKFPSVFLGERMIYPDRPFKPNRSQKRVFFFFYYNSFQLYWQMAKIWNHISRRLLLGFKNGTFNFDNFIGSCEQKRTRCR